MRPRARTYIPNGIPRPRARTSHSLGCHNLGSQTGYATVLAEALEQPLLLPRDMKGLKRIRQLDLFMSLKRDLAMVKRRLSIVQVPDSMFTYLSSTF